MAVVAAFEASSYLASHFHSVAWVDPATIHVYCNLLIVQSHNIFVHASICKNIFSKRIVSKLGVTNACHVYENVSDNNFSHQLCQQK